MQKFKNVISTILCLTMVLFVIPTVVKAEDGEEDYVSVTKLVTDKDEFKTLMAKYIEDLDNHTNNYVDPLFVGTNKIDLSNYITISYLMDGQEELFDYTFENGVITLKIKDYDLYHALITGENITEKNCPDAFKKLEKYLEPEEGQLDLLSGIVGVSVKIYIPKELERSTADYIFENEEHSFLYLDVDRDYEEYYVGQDEKGKYYELIYSGILADYTVFSDEDGNDLPAWVNGRRNLGISMDTWNGGYFVIRNYASDAELLYTDETQHPSYEYYANANYGTISFKYELAATTVEDTNNGVSITGKKDMDSTLTVEKLDTKSDVYKELNERLEGKKVLGAFEVKLNGNYEGKLSVSFNVDSKYNGEKAIVLHKKSNGTVETFEKVITDGKVTVEVDELSPFVIALSNVKADGTPILGVPSYVGLASLLVLCAGVCLIKVLKKD